MWRAIDQQLICWKEGRFEERIAYSCTEYGVQRLEEELVVGMVNSAEEGVRVFRLEYAVENLHTNHGQHMNRGPSTAGNGQCTEETVWYFYCSRF